MIYKWIDGKIIFERARTPLFAQLMVSIVINAYSIIQLWLCINTYPRTGVYFTHVWRRGRLALDPSQNKS